MKICINAGHCPGADPGAVGSVSTEAEVVRDIAKVVVADLEAIGIETLFVQENELYDICRLSNNFGADLFVSIHCNAASNYSARGTETYCYSFNTKGANLAQCINDQIVNSLGTVDRGVKTAKYYVLKETDCPAVLVETAFISNPDDEKLLIGNIEAFAHAIARGVTDSLQ